MAPVGCWYA